MFPGAAPPVSRTPKFAMVEKVYGDEKKVKEALDRHASSRRTTTGIVPNPKREEGQDDEYVGIILTGTHHDDFWEKMYDGKYNKIGGQDQAVFEYGEPYRRTVKVDYKV